jgi:hypothetical protein
MKNIYNSLTDDEGILKNLVDDDDIGIKELLSNPFHITRNGVRVRRIANFYAWIAGFLFYDLFPVCMAGFRFFGLLPVFRETTICLSNSVLHTKSFFPMVNNE